MSENQSRQAVPCPGGTLYVIRAGDTYFQLARRFGTTVTAIAAANPGVNPNNLQIGQTICIPVAPIPGPCPPGTTVYVIQAGDTFFLLAQRFGTTAEAIAAANPGVNPNNLQIGQRICIPVTPTVPPTVPPALALPCCAILSPVEPGGIDGSLGSVLLREAGPGQFTITFTAIGLPSPQVFGNFDRYVGDLAIPQTVPEPPVVFGALLELSMLFGQPPTWAGSRQFAERPTRDSVVFVRPFNTAANLPGPAVLQAVLSGCR